MLAIGDIHVFVSDFDRARRFWVDGLGLTVREQERSPHAAFAILEFPDGGPAIRLFGGVDPWEEGARPPHGSRPTVRFDITTSAFEETLVRVLDHGGSQLGEIERYRESRIVTIADPDGNPFELIEVPGTA